jgi:hypothetical protein
MVSVNKKNKITPWRLVRDIHTAPNNDLFSISRLLSQGTVLKAIRALEDVCNVVASMFLQ